MAGPSRSRRTRSAFASLLAFRSGGRAPRCGRLARVPRIGSTLTAHECLPPLKSSCSRPRCPGCLALCLKLLLSQQPGVCTACVPHPCCGGRILAVFADSCSPTLSRSCRARRSLSTPPRSRARSSRLRGPSTSARPLAQVGASATAAACRLRLRTRSDQAGSPPAGRLPAVTGPPAANTGPPCVPACLPA